MKTGVFLSIALVSASLLASCNSSDPKVDVIHPSVGEIQTSIRATGRVRTVDDVIVRAKENGLLQKVLIKPDEMVEKGQVLVEYDTSDIDRMIAISRSKLKQAQIELDDLAPKKLDKASARLTLAQKKLDSMSRLKEDQITPELDADAAYEEHRLSVLEEQIAKVELDKVLPNTVEIAREELQQLLAQRERMQVTAPIAGQVIEDISELISTSVQGQTFLTSGKLSRLEGMWVVPGQPLFMIADTQRLKVEVEVDEADMGYLKIEQKAIVRSDSFPGNDFSGHVSRIAPSATIMPERTYVQTTILMDDSQGLRIGNQVEVFIVTARKDNALMIPFSAVDTQTPTPRVYTVGADGLLHGKEVTIGITSIHKVEITNGLSTEDQIVLSASAGLREGQRVETVEVSLDY